MFTWEHVPGDESEEGRLCRFLRQSFYVEWAEGHVFTDANGNAVEVDPAIRKSADNKTITVEIGHMPEPGEPAHARIEGAVELELMTEGQEVAAALTIGGAKTYHLTVEAVNGLHKIYRQQNLVDTWYEFTPTGALDVEVGKLSPPLGDDGE
jgi:hypothetical protein